MDHMPAEFHAAYERGDKDVRFAIEQFVRASDGCFLVSRAEFDQTSVRSVRVLYARELVAPSVTAQVASALERQVGALTDVVRHPCPRCGGAGYLYCTEYSDWKFDPDWHSDLYVLCTACPHAERVVHDINGFYSSASRS